MARVSIIMNCFNGEEFLREAIDSLFAQTYTDWEIIFVDNCSTDGSASIAASYGEKVNIVKTCKNIPLYAARNVGLEHVSDDSEFVAFLDVDDLWAPTKLEKQIALFKEDVVMVFCKVKTIDLQGNDVSFTYPTPFRGYVTQRLLIRNFIAISANVVRTRAIKKMKFDPQYNLVGDYELWLRLSIGNKVDYVDELLFLRRVHPESLTIRSKGRWIEELRKHYRSFLKTHLLRYPNILFYALKTEIGQLLGRY